MWSREWCASSCAITTRTSRSLNGGSSSVFQRITRRVGPRPAAKAFGSSVNSLHVLHPHRDVGRRPARARAASPPPAAARFGSGFWSGIRKGDTNANSSPRATNTGRPGNPPVLPQRPASAITIRIATQTKRNTPPSASQLFDHPLEVAQLGDVVAAVPPQLRRARTEAAPATRTRTPASPSSMPVPIRPAADSRVKRSPRGRRGPARRAARPPTAPR